MQILVYRLLFLTIPILFTLGCVPFPHLYPRLPHVSGIVTQEGVPLEGVQISLGEYKDPASCNFDDREASSAKDGSFFINGSRRLRLYIVGVPIHHFERWSLCMKTTDGQTRIYARKRYRAGPVSSPDSISLQCDLSREEDICTVLDEKNGRWS